MLVCSAVEQDVLTELSAAADGLQGVSDENVPIGAESSTDSRAAASGRSKKNYC